MGIIFGKYKEPAFEILVSRNVGAYQVRRYGKRFAVEADHHHDASPFPLLAGYIGVMSWRPQNEAKKYISMTTPVTMHGLHDSPSQRSSRNNRKMQFLLPQEYDNESSIPKPTNLNVRVVCIPPSIGAVYRYTGTLDREKSQEMALRLCDALQEDGVDIDKDTALNTFQYWRYNPPITPAFWSRNEVWIDLNKEQVEDILGKDETPANKANNNKGAG